jgi:hypothetical protein
MSERMKGLYCLVAAIVGAALYGVVVRADREPAAPPATVLDTNMSNLYLRACESL